MKSFHNKQKFRGEGSAKAKRFCELFCTVGVGGVGSDNLAASHGHGAEGDAEGVTTLQGSSRRSAFPPAPAMDDDT